MKTVNDIFSLAPCADPGQLRPLPGVYFSLEAEC
jgi:hypothetical protein